MSRDLPRAQVDVAKSHTLNIDLPQQALPPFIIELEHTGPVTMLHAAFANVGEISLNDGAPRIGLMLGTTGCRCGCGATGRGAIYTPDVDAARAFAASIVARADELEAAAAVAADAAIAAAKAPR